MTVVTITDRANPIQNVNFHTLRIQVFALLLIQKKKTFTKMYNMDHIHISGTDPSSVILSHTKVEKGCLKVPRQAEAKRDVEIYPKNYNSKQF